MSRVTSHRFRFGVFELDARTPVRERPRQKRAGAAADFPATDDRPRVGGRAPLASVGISVVALVAALAVACRSPSIAASRGNQARLAVLPFDDLAGDGEQFFADGLHEEMIVRLGRLQPRRLAVIA